MSVGKTFHSLYGPDTVKALAPMSVKVLET